LSGQRDWTGVLGAVSEDGEEFYCQSDEYITGEHARKFILALSNEFDEDLIVVLDGAPYFRSSTVTELEDRDDLDFVRLPPYSPDMNPVEECWRQLKATLKNRFFEDLPDLKQAIQRGLDDISTPDTSNYL
jgi:transposase